MKNSKGQELPQPYLDLAIMRREQQKDSDYVKMQLLVDAFNWGNTPEKYSWWGDVYRGYSPEIPASSLAELEAWRKQREESKQSDFWGMAAMVADELRPEPDYKAMYEDLLQKHTDLFAIHQKAMAECDMQPSRNWIAECAMQLFSTGVSLELSWDKAQKWEKEGKNRGHI